MSTSTINCPECNSDRVETYKLQHGTPGGHEWTDWFESGLRCLSCGRTRIPDPNADAAPPVPVSAPSLLEETDPALAEHIHKILHGVHPAVLGFNTLRNVHTGHFHYRMRPRRKPPTQGRNDPCSCGSGNKFKRCCGK